MDRSRKDWSMMSQTVAVTFGYGRFRGVARGLAARWNRLNTYPCIDVTDRIPWDKVGPHPQYGKAYLWDVLPPEIDRLLWVDSDSFPCRELPLVKLPDVPFAAVENGPWNEGRFRKNTPKRTPAIKRLFNSGVFVARRRETEAILKRLREHEFDKHVGYFEQPWLNLLVQEMLGGWTELPVEMNWRPKYAARIKVNEEGRLPYIIHTAGWVDLTVIRMLYHISEGASWKALSSTQDTADDAP